MVPKEKHNTSMVVGLLLIDLSLFIGAVTFLPKASNFSYNGPIERFFNSRLHWDYAAGLFFAALVLSAGIAALAWKHEDS